MDYLLHRKQFVIARRAVTVDTTWRQTDLADGWILSYQQDLALEIDTGDPVRPDVVIGALYCEDPATGRGAGRFARIRWPRVSGDPAGLLSLHVGRMDGELAVSSSPALAMLALTGTIPPYDITSPLRHPAARRTVPGSSINYVPAPGTRWHAVRRLFCDQRIDLSTGAIEHADHGIRPLGGFEAACDLAASELLRFAGELKSRIPGTIFLPLTAGIDSRTLAAALLAADVPFETVTYRFVGKPETDITVAAAISRRCGLRHHVIDLEPLVPGVSELVERHVSGAVIGWDITHVFPGNVYRYLRPGDAMIRGCCFALGRRHYARQLGDFDFAAANGAEIWRANSGEPGPEELSGFLDDWHDWRARHLDGLDWLSAHYLDQRLTGWEAALEHGYDLLPAVVLNPANNARIYSALLTLDPEDQAAGRLQKALIARFAPELTHFPINPLTLGDRLRRVRNRIRSRLQLRRRLAPILPGLARTPR